MAHQWVNLMCDAMQVPNVPGVFVLGSFERRVTIYAQQVRALNLVAALISLHQMGPDKKVAVIGAGVAGLTFAAAAARLGISVTMLEREDRPIPLLRDAPNRWLHPRIYDWPHQGWNHEKAGLPVLDWRAGTVEEVSRQLDLEWAANLQAAGPLIEPVYNAKDIRVGREGGRVWVSWCHKADTRMPKPKVETFAVVVLAVGFGVERYDLPGCGSYWKRDDLDCRDWFVSGRDEPKSWLVSGAGDGALTDLLRLCIRDFRHSSITDVVKDSRLELFAERILAIESDPCARDLSQPWYLHESYQKLEAGFLCDSFRSALRDDSRVTLNAATPFYLRAGSSSLNRFLVSQLCHAGGFDFVPGEIDFVRMEEGRACVGLKDKTILFRDRVLLRHGPRPSLREFGNVWEETKELRAVWKIAPHLLDQTRERYWEEGIFGPEERFGGVLQDADAVRMSDAFKGSTSLRLETEIGVRHADDAVHAVDLPLARSEREGYVRIGDPETEGVLVAWYLAQAIKRSDFAALHPFTSFQPVVWRNLSGFLRNACIDGAALSRAIESEQDSTQLRLLVMIAGEANVIEAAEPICKKVLSEGRMHRQAIKRLGIAVTPFLAVVRATLSRLGPDAIPIIERYADKAKRQGRWQEKQILISSLRRRDLRGGCSD